MFNRFILLSLFIATLFSCTKDDNSIQKDYSRGTFIVNEGLFNSGTGTITYLNDDEQIDDIFELQNPGLVLGNIAQSMIFHDNKYFIAVNNSAKIVVVNAVDFKYIGEIPVNLPRYFVNSNGKLYVTSWSSDFTSGFINLIDTKTLTISKSTAIQGLAEKMLSKDNNVYITVTASEWDPLNHHVVVYDTQKEVLTGTIEAGDNTNDLALDKNGDIWLLCSGFTNYTDPGLSTDGSIHKIVNNKVAFSKKLPNGCQKLVVNNNKSELYYLNGSSVMELNITKPDEDSKAVYSGLFYNLAIHPVNDNFYLLNAKDFQQKGELTILNKDFKQVKNVTTGIIPAFVYFNN